jgi:hypothetical protein
MGYLLALLFGRRKRDYSCFVVQSREYLAMGQLVHCDLLQIVKVSLTTTG